MNRFLLARDSTKSMRGMAGEEEMEDDGDGEIEDDGEGEIEDDGEEEMEDDDEDDDDDVDFNPYLQRSPSADRDFGNSSTRDRESEDAEEEREMERQEDAEAEADGVFDNEESANLAIECLQMKFKGSDQFLREFEGNGNFMELASEDYEDEEVEEVEEVEDAEQEETLHSGTYSTKNMFKGKEREYLEGCLNEIDYGVRTCAEEDLIVEQTVDGLRKRLNEKDCSISSGNIVYGSQDKLEMDEMIGMQSFANSRSNEEGDCLVDAISKRTRAHYSLTDMSLDQLETFLQESDEDEYFQTVDDEEEYRKFLLAVQEIENPLGKPEQSSWKEDEDNEEEDVDFEIEIEEALESDDASEILRKRRRRRPKTIEKRRQRAQFQIKGPLNCQTNAHLRQLLPHVGNLDRRETMTETENAIWPANAKRKTPVNGFTAHQIGQLYCLIHEHVQLLIQVYSLCILEPARQQMAVDTHRMLMELAEKRELLLSWKKTAFPDFCFRPPYTHPSLLEVGDQATFVHSLTPDISTSTPAPCRQSTQLSSQGSVSDLDSSGTSCSHNLGQNSTQLPQSYSLSRIFEQPCSAHHYAAPSHFSEQIAGKSQSFYAWIPCPDQRQRSQTAAEGVSASHGRILSGGSYCDLRGPFMVDPTSLSTIRLKSPHDLFYPRSHCSDGDLVSVTGNYFHSSVTTTTKAPLQVVSCNHDSRSNLGVINPDPSSSAMVQSATLNDDVHTCVSRGPAAVLGGQLELAWAPVTSGPVRSLLDVAPLALVRDFLTDVSHAVQEHRQGSVESGAYHIKCAREPFFMTSANDEQGQNFGRSIVEGTRSWLFGGGEACPACVPRPQIKKTMATALVESTRKRSLALVPKDAAIAVQRFLPYFNKVFFPHKPPPLATASRLLFTDAEDELLAMGLMIYNTDWKAIQQRFLPSKSMHQIFVRQKNRSSARAPENSIKAVRRMKSSPLTHSEKSSIQEGLGMFKYDWNKVWQYCVPHRDPATLPRQWRIAVGTQKSYKTSETSKERRRLYEANRRQRIAAKKTNEITATMEEDGHPSCTETSLQDSSGKVGSKDVEDPDNTYIREAFLDNWCPGSTSIVASGPTVTSAEKQQTQFSSLSKKKKAKVELEVYSLSSTPWLEKAVCQSRKQTVKLAPGLPSVKLPPFVQVLSQSQIHTQSQIKPQQPFPSRTRVSPVTSQWVQMTSQGLSKLELSVQSIHLQSSSLSNCVTEATTMHDGAPTPVHSAVRLNYSASRQAQTLLKKVPPDAGVSNEQIGLMTRGPTQFLDKKSRLALLSPMENNQINAALFQPIVDLGFANDLNLDPVQGQMGKGNARECSEQGGVQVRRNLAKRNKKLDYGNNKVTKIGKEGIPSSSSTANGSQEIAPILVIEGVDPDIPTSSYRGKAKGRSRSKKNQKLQEACDGKVNRESHLEQHIIVMEQEELSDSEDETDGGVEFEHEEIGDSDKDAEVEFQYVKHSRASKPK